MKHFARAAFLLGLLIAPGAAQSQATPPDPKRAAEFLADSAAGVQALQTRYVDDKGQWTTTNRWNAANGITMLSAYAKLSDSPDLKPTLANTFVRNSQKNFLNEYYDDQGWWALGWAGAYEVTRDARYLEMSETIFGLYGRRVGMILAGAVSGGRSRSSTRTPSPTNCFLPWRQNWRV